MAENDNSKNAKHTPEKKREGESRDINSDAEDSEARAAPQTIQFDNVHHDASALASLSSPKRATNATAVENSHVVYQGRTRLTRGDDPHWLSEADCFIRQELAEVFTAHGPDLDLFGDPEKGQVGIRCFYCAKNKPPEERNRG